MKISVKQADAIRNAIAAEFDPYHSPYKLTGKTGRGQLDPKAWQGADIPTRQSLNTIIKKIRKL